MRLTYVWSSLPVLLLASLFLRVPSAQSGKADVYQKWLEEDVHWIITDHERAEFMKLSTDQQRVQFVEAFWSRRDPTPGTPENEFKAEHYRRLAYSNAHFASGVPGWKTDRGHVYIIYGTPDEIHTQPAPATQQTAKNAGSNYPTQTWRYHHLNGASHDLTVPFVDTCRCGDYQLKIDLFKEHELP